MQVPSVFLPLTISILPGEEVAFSVKLTLGRLVMREQLLLQMQMAMVLLTV